MFAPSRMAIGQRHFCTIHSLSSRLLIHFNVLWQDIILKCFTVRLETFRVKEHLTDLIFLTKPMSKKRRQLIKDAAFEKKNEHFDMKCFESNTKSEVNNNNLFSSLPHLLEKRKGLCPFEFKDNCHFVEHFDFHTKCTQGIFVLVCGAKQWILSLFTGTLKTYIFF